MLVLLQHQFLSSLDKEEEKDQIKDQMFSEETNTALFSLVGIDPRSGKSALCARLYPPEAWSGRWDGKRKGRLDLCSVRRFFSCSDLCVLRRLCEADVRHSSVVGLNQSGGVCVWELRKPKSHQVEAPEGEDWQLARWAGEDTLLIGHHNGDVSLLHYWRCFSSEVLLWLGRRATKMHQQNTKSYDAGQENLKFTLFLLWFISLKRWF